MIDYSVEFDVKKPPSDVFAVLDDFAEQSVEKLKALLS
jgi:carbon monoxide dehydrogenase subunit G